MTGERKDAVERYRKAAREMLEAPENSDEGLKKWDAAMNVRAWAEHKMHVSSETLSEAFLQVKRELGK